MVFIFLQHEVNYYLECSMSLFTFTVSFVVFDIDMDLKISPFFPNTWIAFWVSSRTIKTSLEFEAFNHSWAHIPSAKYWVALSADPDLTNRFTLVSIRSSFLETLFSLGMDKQFIKLMQSFCWMFFLASSDCFCLNLVIPYEVIQQTNGKNSIRTKA